MRVTSGAGPPWRGVFRAVKGYVVGVTGLRGALELTILTSLSCGRPVLWWECEVFVVCWHGNRDLLGESPLSSLAGSVSSQHQWSGLTYLSAQSGPPCDSHRVPQTQPLSWVLCRRGYWDTDIESLCSRPRKLGRLESVLFVQDTWSH